MTRQDILALRARIASIPRDPHGPDLEQQEHVIKLKPPITEDDHVLRLGDAQDWCRE